MSVISGKRAVMAGVGSLRNWKAQRSITIPAPRGSSTAGMPACLVGNKDWSGSAEFYGYIPTNLPGASFTFQGNPDTGNTGIWTGTAIVSSLTVVIDIEAAQPISGTIQFEGNGELTASTATISDATTPAIYPSKGMKGTLAGSDIVNVRRMEFTLTCKNETYVTGGDSGTSGIVKRVPGNFDASGSFTVYDGAPSTALAYGTIDVLRYYVTASYYWAFSYVVLESNNPEADREGGTIPGLTYPWRYTGWKDITGTWTQGSISNVAGSTTTWWP